MSQITAYIAGTGAAPIEQITPSQGIVVVPDASGNIDMPGTLPIITTGTANTLTISVDGTVPTSFITDLGTATPSSNSLTVAGGTNIVTSGSGSTLTIDLDGQVAVANGGTGASSFTAYAVVCGGSTSTNPLQSVSGVGTSGQVLTSNGAGSLPTWEDASGGGVVGPVSSTDNALARWDGTAGNTLQDSSVIVSDAGEMTNASQPAFLAFNSANDTNQTGNGALVTVDFDTEVYDQGNDFSADTFTAPVTGKYNLTTVVRFASIGAGMNIAQSDIVTSNRTYRINYSPEDLVNGSGLFSVTLSATVDMDASDTAVVQVAIDGGVGDTATISGNATVMLTYFSGYLVC